MALLTNDNNKVLTPEEIAKNAVADKKFDTKMDSSAYDELIKITRYNNRDTINVRGEKYWEKNKMDLINDSLVKLITDRSKALTKYIDKKEQDASMEYFRLLRSKGVSIEDAAKMANVTL